jgi:hypothetical protein
MHDHADRHGRVLSRLSDLQPMAAGCDRSGSGRWLLPVGPRYRAVVNPARQFGPAVLADQGTDLWIYLTAPIVGAVFGAGFHHLLYRRFRTRQPLTCKLAGSGSPTDRARGNARRIRAARHLAFYGLASVPATQAINLPADNRPQDHAHSRLFPDNAVVIKRTRPKHRTGQAGSARFKHL